YTARHIVVATGARPRVLPGLEPDGDRIWTYFEAMAPKELPQRLLIVGSGAIGVEFASFYNSLGSNVTVVELLPQILPAEDEEVSAFARKQLEKAGVRFVTGAKVTGLKKATDSVTATVDLGDGRTEEVVADRVIS